MRDYIRLLINGREHQVRGRSAFATLANYLRYDASATGTKIVCEEGDCGACTVLVRRGTGEFVAVNSCILAMAQLDGTSIITVEGLKREGVLSAVQQAMVDNHGAQCGYCTPGFVVAMTAMYESGRKVGEQDVRDGLTGNLCRCTGYEPIIKAALAANGTESKPMRELYPQTIDDDSSLRIDVDGRIFFAPATIDEAIAFKRERAPVTIVQGGTDVGVWVNKRGYSAPAMMSLAKIRELDGCTFDGTRFVAGANTTLTEFERAIDGSIPELQKILHVFGSPQIKNAGTLVGNIANGSPIGDTLPYLLVADATLEVRGSSGTRHININDFYKGYRTLDLAADEIITRVTVPVVTSVSPWFLKLYKVSRRKDLDISAFTAAILLRVNGSTIEEARIAFGGVAPVVLRMRETEKFLAGKTIARETFQRAGEIARAEVKPISDVRGSREYRLQLSENIWMKFFYEAFATPPPSARPQRMGAPA